MVGIDQQLDGDISDALYAADAPSATNPVVTRNATPAFVDEKQFVSVTNFDTGSLPVGWTGSVVGTGASIVYTQAYESGVSPGMALATLGTATGSRVSILTGSGFQYMRSFTDGPETTFFIQARWSGVPSPTNSAHIMGWINSNSFSPIPTIGNTLAIVYDPTNASGTNPGLITNLFLLARANYGTPTANTVVDLGIPYDNVNWRAYKIVYDNVLGQVRVYRDNVLLTTLTDLSNVPGGAVRGTIPTGAGNGVAAGFYIGNQGVAATGSAIRVAKVSVFKRFV
jgi:hypothetical protein